MKVRAAVVEAPGSEWDIQEIDLLENLGPTDVMVRMEAAGLCHSDEHLRLGSLPSRFPFVGGHEGAGTVLAVGPEVTSVAAGDRVVCCFRPACGQCAQCKAGRGNLCERSSRLGSEDVLKSFRRDGEPVAATNLIGAFATHTVCPESSVIKVPHDIPVEVAALLGCAIPTGVGAALNAGKVKPGDKVLVIGTGGVGINAIQGARIGQCGLLVAVDNSLEKHAVARAFGADQAFSSLDELAASGHAKEGFDVVIVTVGVAALVSQSIGMIAPGGTLVLAALGNPESYRLDVPINALVRSDITIRGTILGSTNLRSDIDTLIAHYRDGSLKLDELITHRYTLDELPQGYRDLQNAELVRGVVIF